MLYNIYNNSLVLKINNITFFRYDYQRVIAYKSDITGLIDGILSNNIKCLKKINTHITNQHFVNQKILYYLLYYRVLIFLRITIKMNKTHMVYVEFILKYDLFCTDY